MSDFTERLEKYVYEKGLTPEEYKKSIEILLYYSGVKTVSKLAKEKKC